MPNRDYHQERRDYAFAELRRDQLRDNPSEQFSDWMDQAIEQGMLDPTAMSLATVDSEGQPHSRIVLLKAFGQDGFVFYTHYQSAKGAEIDANDKVALLFFWPEMDRQIRIEGRIEKVSKAQSEHYFHSRPQGSQLAAYISAQSQLIESREALEDKLETVTQSFKNRAVPHPEHWGGYRVIPNQFEFWQGRPSRLHDRFRYRKQDGTQEWGVERLAP